jgi:hypothetical protein
MGRLYQSAPIGSVLADVCQSRYVNEGTKSSGQNEPPTGGPGRPVQYGAAPTFLRKTFKQNTRLCTAKYPLRTLLEACTLGRSQEFGLIRSLQPSVGWVPGLDFIERGPPNRPRAPPVGLTIRWNVRHHPTARLEAAAFGAFREGEPPCEPGADARSDGASHSQHRRRGLRRARYNHGSVASGTSPWRSKCSLRSATLR